MYNKCIYELWCCEIEIVLFKPLKFFNLFSIWTVNPFCNAMEVGLDEQELYKDWSLKWKSVKRLMKQGCIDAIELYHSLQISIYPADVKQNLSLGENEK